MVKIIYIKNSNFWRKTMATTPELEQALQEITSAMERETKESRKLSKEDLRKLPYIDAEDYLINGECLDFKKS